MALIPFNVLSSSQLFDIDERDIIELIPINSAANSTLVYEKLGRQHSIDVEEVAATVASSYPVIFPLVCFVSGTSGNTVTRYLSALKCNQVIEFSSYSLIQYNTSGVDFEAVGAALPGDGGITFAALVSLIDTTSSAYVTIAGTQTVTGAKTFSAKLVTSAGAVANPGLVVGANDNGLYEVSSAQLGASVGNTLVGGFNASGLFTDVISEQTSAVGVTVDGVLLKDSTATVVEVISKGVASTEGYGLITLKSKSSSITCSGGATEVIPVQVPSGAVLVGAQLRNDTLLTATTGVSYSAALSGGSTISIGSGIAFAKNTKVSGLFNVNSDDVVTSGATDITLTPNAGTLDTGTVTAVVYYYVIGNLTDAA